MAHPKSPITAIGVETSKEPGLPGEYVIDTSEYEDRNDGGELVTQEPATALEFAKRKSTSVLERFQSKRNASSKNGLNSMPSALAIFHATPLRRL